MWPNFRLYTFILVVTSVMVMKASMEDDDSGWEISMQDKMGKTNANWIDITQEFRDACSGKSVSLVYNAV